MAKKKVRTHFKGDTRWPSEVVFIKRETQLMFTLLPVFLCCDLSGDMKGTLTFKYLLNKVNIPTCYNSII